MFSMRSVRPLRSASGTALLLAAALSPAFMPGLAAQKLGPGSPAPKLDVAWVKGDPIDLAKGEHVVVVECWATWCGPCIASIPHVTALQAKLRDKGLRVVGVAVWDEREKVDAFLARRGKDMAYAIAFDEKQSIANDWLQAAGQNGIPCSFVVNREGKIAWIGHPMAGLDDVVADVLAGTHDVEVARMLWQKDAAINDAFKAEDWTSVAKIADEILQRAPQRPEPWIMKFIATKSSGAAAEEVGAIANTALQALGNRPKQLSTFVQFALLRGEGDAVASQAALALPAVETALEQHAENSDLLLVHVRLLDAAGKEKEAVAAAQAAVKKLAKDSHALVTLATQLGDSQRAKAFAAPALAALKAAKAELGDAPELLRTEFAVLLASEDVAAAKVVGKKLVEKLAGNCGELNSFAWGLLTDEPTKGRFQDLALVAAQAMTTCEDHENPPYLDTIALAKFENGMVDEAIELQEKAIGMGVDDPEYKDRLDMYKKAKAEGAAKKAGAADADAKRGESGKDRR